MTQSPTLHKSGYVALVGKPNAGKSTLLNQIIGQKLSIVTQKPQTTRHRILGILSKPDHQIIFLDTPGIIAPRYKLQERMMNQVNFAVQDADVVVFIVDVTEDKLAKNALSKLSSTPTILALNKMDAIPKEKAIPLITAYNELHAFEAIVPISAKTGENIPILLDELLKHIPVGPPFYPAEMLSEHPERFFVAEIIREKIFLELKQEIPYSTAVNIVAYKERPEQKDFIDAEIVVERNSQKGILIGKKGNTLKNIGKLARIDIEEFLQKPVYLQLHVKVRTDWRNQDTYLHSYGYD